MMLKKRVALYATALISCISLQAHPVIKTKTAILLPQQGEQVMPLEKTLQELSPCLEKWANNQFAGLNESIHFDPSFIVDSARVRERHFKYKNDPNNRGERVTVVTEDEIAIECTYFNRNSDRLLIIGEGFTNDREKMTPFLSLFSNYDIVLFDFRGQGYQPQRILTPTLFGSVLASYITLELLSKKGPETGSFGKIAKRCALSTAAGLFISTFGLNPTKWRGTLSQMTFGVDSSKLTLGNKEEKDVVAVVQEFKDRKKENSEGYKQVYGLGVCYGAFMLPKTEALYPKTFDKLILDGCWHDLPAVIKKLRHDLRMTCNPQQGGWSKIWPLNRTWCQDSIEFIARNILGLQFDGKTSVEDFIGRIGNTPLLFFHGKDDLLVPFNEFKQIWESVKTPQKAAIVTSNEHVINHLKQKQLYKAICELFFDYDFKTFTNMMQNLDTHMSSIKKHFDTKLHGE